MSKSPTVTVQYAIVHLTNVDDDAPSCSEIDLDLGGNPELRDYFTAQVQHALDDDDVAAARFATSGSQDARNASERILANQSAFITVSQELARLMLLAMKTHPRISPGSLAVCVYNEDGQDARHVALMKLDPSSALVLREGKRNGKKLYTFDIQQNVMPTLREKLQKAALLPPAGSEKYDLLLLDRQTRQVTTAWWAETFLNVTLIIDGKLGATSFNSANQQAIRALTNSGKSAEAEQVRTQSLAAMRNDRVKLSAYVASLPKEAQELVRTELDKRFARARTVPIDTEYAASKLTFKTKFRGDWGVVIEYETEYEDRIVEARTPLADGTTRFVLRVPNVKQIK